MTRRNSTADLLWLAAHEFRTPVSVLAGWLRILSREQLGTLNDRQKALVAETEKACARLSALVKEVSELGDLEAGSASMTREAVALDPVLDEAVSTLEEGRDRGVVVTRAAAEPLPSVRGDRTRLRDVVHCLLFAVLREQSTPVTVTVHSGVRVVDGVKMLAVAIGPGDTVPAVLDLGGPDARLNEARGGLGLSLPIARRVVESLGGRVWSSSPAERALGAVAILLPVKEN